MCTGQPLKALHNSLCNEACAVSSLPSRYRTHARLNKTCSLVKVSSQMNFALEVNIWSKLTPLWAAVTSLSKLCQMKDYMMCFVLLITSLDNYDVQIAAIGDRLSLYFD